MEEDRKQIAINAEQDAQSDTNKLIWFVAGFALNVLGLLLAYIYQPPPPASRFLEKSQLYTVLYTDAYKAKSRSIQVTYSLIGFLITGSLILVYIIFVFSTLFSLNRGIW